MADMIETAEAPASVQAQPGADQAPAKPKRPGRKPAQDSTKGNESAEASPPPSDPAAPAAASKGGTTNKAARNNRDAQTEPWYVRSVQKTLQRMADESKPVRKQKITLKTRHAQEMYTRFAVLWAETVLTLSVTMRNFKPEAQCLIVDGEVDRAMDVPAEFIKAEFERLNTLADNNGVDLSDTTDVEYTNPAQYAVAITAPRERRFYELLQEFDKLCISMDALWMSSLVTDRARSKSAYDVKRALTRALYQARNLVFRAQASSDRNGIHKIKDPRASNDTSSPTGQVADQATSAANADAASRAPEAEEALAAA